MRIALSKCIMIIAFIALISTGIFWYFFTTHLLPIKIGIIHSQTGSLALSEKQMIDAELLALEEINAQGGVLKRKIIPIIVDGQSDENIFAQEAERLITEEKVVAIIGGWTSASRKAMKAVVEKHNNLLIYPVSYEGIEDSSNVLYTGSTQNQQIIPSVLWSVQNLGKRFFLIGSEEIFSHLAHEIVKNTLAQVGGQVVGEEYILLQKSDVHLLIEKIKKANPDVIINTIEGENNVLFFKEFRAQGFTPEKLPVMSIGSVGETEFAAFGTSARAGDYATASYFQSIDREENNIFVANFKKKYGAERVVSDSMQAGYISLHIWAQAAQSAGATQPEMVTKHLHNQVFNAPEGIVYIDNTILSAWRMVYVGKLRADGQFTIVWDSKKTIQPINFPLFKEKKDWHTLMNDWYEKWGGRWSKMAG